MSPGILPAAARGEGTKSSLQPAVVASDPIARSIDLEPIPGEGSAGLTTVRGLSDNRRVAREVEFQREGNTLAIRMHPPGNSKGSVVRIPWPAFHEALSSGAKEASDPDTGKGVAFRLP